MWHVWIKAFRERESLTQEQAATMLGVEARTIRRWEAAETEPSATVRNRLTPMLIPSPAHRLGHMMQGILDVTSDFIILFDADLKVVRQSKSHAAHMFAQYGRASMVGEDWRKYMPQAFDQYVADMGGPRGMISNGFVSIRAGFVRQAGEKGGAMQSAGISDHSLLRLDDGVAHMSVTRQLKPDDLPSTPPTITFLST